MPPGSKRLPQPLVDFHVHLFPREDEIDTLLGLDLSQAFYDAVFRDNGLRLIREGSQVSA
jgi:hypothetical protein